MFFSDIMIAQWPKSSTFYQQPAKAKVWGYLNRVHTKNTKRHLWRKYFGVSGGDVAYGLPPHYYSAFLLLLNIFGDMGGGPPVKSGQKHI